MTARRWLPDGLAGRFVLVLAAALIAANLAALALFSVDRARLERDALIQRELERLVSLLPVIEREPPRQRGAVVRAASTRFSRLTVDGAPAATVGSGQPPALVAALRRDLRAELPGREISAATLPRTSRDGRALGDALAVSIALRTPPGTPPQWLNLLTIGERRPPGGIDERLLLVTLGLSLVCVLAVGLVFVRRLTRPLHALARAAGAAGRGDRTARVPATGAREMRQAAAAFNDMQGQIARFDAERMRVLAAVGHDLRTPITSLRIRAEMLEDDTARGMIRTLDDMTVMANGLVTFAKGTGEAEPIQTVDLNRLLMQLCSDRGAQTGDTVQAQVRVRPVALGRAIGNLIDNAQRYGGGARVAARIEGAQAVITIDDDGPGIDPDLLDRIFDPFVRGDTSRNSDTGGAGLGLSIARSVISALGGSVALENRAGGGVRATVRLPLA